MSRPLPLVALAVMISVVLWRLGVPWLVPALALAVGLVFLARRVVVWPVVGVLAGSVLAWVACLGVAPAPVAEPGRGAVVVRLDRFPEPPGEGRRALEGRVVAATEVPALQGQRVRVDVPGWAGPYRVGDRVRVEGRWKPMTGELFLARGLRYRASSPRPALVVGRAEGLLADAERGLQAARDHLAAGASAVGGGAAPLLASLVLGVRGDVPREDLDVLATTGVIHLFAISGGQLALFGGLLFLCIRGLARLWRPARLGLLDRKAGAVLAILAALGFTWLTGSNVSTQRSFWMIFLYFLGVLLDRETDGVSFLSASLTLLLLWNPTALFDPSLQLSAVGVAALFLAARSSARSFAGRAFVASWWAFVLTAPIGFGYFDRAALATPLANVLVVPLFSIVVMPLAFLVVFVAPLWPLAASWLAMPLGWVLDATFAGLRVVAAVVPAPTTLAGFVVTFVPLAGLGSLALVAWERRAKRLAAGRELRAPRPA